VTGENKNLQIIHGDARHIPLQDESVQCIVTSPPYWGLRKYAGEQELIWFPDYPDENQFAAFQHHQHEWGAQERGKRKDILPAEETTLTARIGVDDRQNDAGTDGGRFCIHCGAWRGAYGLEPTIEMYVAHTLEILRECWRMLRHDGVLFWNIGDSYASTGGHADVACNDRRGEYNLGNRPEHNQRDFRIRGNAAGALKPKDLCLVPARVALAAQADGWWVRSMIIWAKPNPMPESTTDRPTDAYEHILMLTKSERYFWDADAVREPASILRPEGPNAYRGQSAIRPRGPHNAFGYTPKGTHSRGTGDGGPKARARAADGVHEGWAESTAEMLAYRNVRNVWMFATQPYSGAHFATFPEELPRRCILAATSARGACAQCGAPWERVTRNSMTSGKSWNGDALKNAGINRNENNDFAGSNFYENYQPAQTIGWRPTCICRGQHGKTVPCLVLDPFGGSGTTGRVALELRRRAVLVDIAYNAEYRALAERRTRGVNVKLPFL
jgi:DNA modification methylase